MRAEQGLKKLERRVGSSGAHCVRSGRLWRDTAGRKGRGKVKETMNLKCVDLCPRRKVKKMIDKKGKLGWGGKENERRDSRDSEEK